MRLRPLTFLTFQQFPFFHLSVNLSSSQSFISSFPLLIIIHPLFRLLFIIPVIYSSSRSSIPSFRLFIVIPFIPSSFFSPSNPSSSLSASSSYPPSLRHFHHLSVIPTISLSFPPSFRHIALSLRCILQFLTIIAQRLFFNSV